MKIIISGYGKMGKELEKILQDHELTIVSPETNISFTDINFPVDVIIDFSIAKVINEIYDYSRKYSDVKIIIGTTNYSNSELELIDELSKSHVVIKSSNYSKGMNILFSMIETLSRYDLNEEDIYLIEKHHKYKKDSPSGTSKTIKDLISKPIQIECIKNGDIIGEHKLDVYLENECISIKHTAYSRKIFVQGVIEVLKIVENLSPGLYSLEEIGLWKEKK